MSGERLNWQQIEERFQGEWIQLVDFVWPEGETVPVSGVINAHASDRKEFFAKVGALSPKHDESAFLFVGTPPRAPGFVYSNFHNVVR